MIPVSEERLPEGLYVLKTTDTPCYVHADGRIEFPNHKFYNVSTTELLPLNDVKGFIKRRTDELGTLIGFVKVKCPSLESQVDPNRHAEPPRNTGWVSKMMKTGSLDENITSEEDP
jgi:hypothetical protein